VPKIGEHGTKKCFRFFSCVVSRVSVVGIATTLRAGRSGCRTPVEVREIFLFHRTSVWAQGSIQPYPQWVPTVNGGGPEVAHSLPSGAKVQYERCCDVMVWTDPALRGRCGTRCSACTVRHCKLPYCTSRRPHTIMCWP